MALTDKLKAIGNAIRSKTGKSDALTLEQMPTEIASIQTGSSDIPFIKTGLNAQLVATYDEAFTLADTSFIIGSSPSTSATSIKATVSNRFTSASIAIGDKDVIVVQKCIVKPKVSSDATGKVQQISYVYMHTTFISKGRRSATDTSLYARRTHNATGVYIRYYNSSGVDTIASASYGMYCTPSAATVASTTAASTTVRCSSPVLYSRASTTYFSQANMSKIVDCTWDWHIDVYLCDEQSSMSSWFQEQAFDLMF